MNSHRQQQCLNGLSPSMDVFSYGVLLLEMITRRIPLPEERVGLIDGIRRVSF